MIRLPVCSSAPPNRFSLGARRPSPPRVRALERPIDTNFRPEGKAIRHDLSIFEPRRRRAHFRDGQMIQSRKGLRFPRSRRRLAGHLLPGHGPGRGRARYASRRSDGRLRDRSGSARTRGLADSCRRLFHGIAPGGVFRPYSRQRPHGRRTRYRLGRTRRSRPRAPDHGAGEMVHADEGLRLPGAGGRLPDVFCHVSAVEASGRDTLPQGAVVTCDIAPRDRGPQVSRILTVDPLPTGHDPAERSRPFDSGYPAPQPGAPTSAVLELPATVKFFDPARGFGFVVLDSCIPAYCFAPACPTWPRGSASLSARKPCRGGSRRRRSSRSEPAPHRGNAALEKRMNEPDEPQSASEEEEARIAQTPAVFANKVFVSSQPAGAKIIFAQGRRTSGEELASPRVAVFL